MSVPREKMLLTKNSIMVNASKSQHKENKETVEQVSKMKKLPKGTFSDYRKQQFGKSPLFQKIYSVDDENTLKEVEGKKPSILVTGFGMRNIQSLQDALRMREEERQRLLEIYRHVGAEEAKEETKYPSEISMRSSISSTKLANMTFKSVSSETGTELKARDAQQQKLCLEYLLGLEKTLGEGEAQVPKQYSIQEQSLQSSEFRLSKSRAMREAQLYLLQHRILDFFQFIVCHLLGATPENPITFIIELLNKCLLYRSRLGQPPVLYEKRHLEQLFILMDRMKCGKIEMSQYVNGISSLGICDFNENPLTDEEGCITKKVFVNEAYKAQVYYFNELIKTRKLKKILESSMSDLEAATLDSSGSYFIPTGLFSPMKKLTTKHSKGADIDG